MKKAFKIVGYLVLALIVMCILAIGALFAYKKYMLRGSVDFNEQQSYYMNEIPMEPSDFNEDFESIFNRVNHRYAYIDRKHLNMDSLHEVFINR